MNYNVFIFIVSFFSILVLLVLAIGYAVYEYFPDVKSWEQGVKKVLTFSYELFYEGFTGNKIERKRIDNSLFLSVEELEDLKNMLKGHPFDTPVIAYYDANATGDIISIAFNAIRLSKTYRDLSEEELHRMCKYIIHDFYILKRGHCPEFYIHVASSTHLRFSIPISYDALCRLRNEFKSNTLNKAEEPSHIDSQKLEINVEINEGDNEE